MKGMARDRAVPKGAIPVELWSELFDTTAESFDSLGGVLMHFIELFQFAGVNPREWCEGQGCAIPKPGGATTPDGYRIINLLDPLGKAFYKTVLGMHPDFPAPFQYGYSARRAEGCHLAAHDCVAETT